jgi:F-type H+-transporting ATPase subunit b
MAAFTVSVTAAGELHVRLLSAQEEGEEVAEEEEPDEGPSPIAPELKELAWGLGAFVVFLILVRLVFYPRIKRGMDARRELIRSELEEAERTEAEAEGEVAQYQARLAEVRAEVAKRIDAARQELDQERQAQLAEVNARIAEQRAAAAADVEVAKAGAQPEIVAAAAEVAAAAAERVLGRPVDAAAARAAADAAVSAGVPS